ncbi:MAG TPA: glycosyltransferase family 87 protein, partial [Caulobacteraceae bacterium]|nr:glycosyltransferase family 87 protein [Caulobacteraceae bacterium]
MKLAFDDRASRGLVGLLAFVVWTAVAIVHAPEKAADFYVFWTAGQHASAPYDPAIIAAMKVRFHIVGQVPFVYPPTFLLLVWPFAQLPLALAYPLWTGLSAALFFYAAAHVVRPAWAAVALFIAPPVVLAIAPGQTSLVVGAAMMFGWLALKERPALAGLVFAIAACIKPQAMLLAPVVLW